MPQRQANPMHSHSGNAFYSARQNLFWHVEMAAVLWGVFSRGVREAPGRSRRLHTCAKRCWEIRGASDKGRLHVAGRRERKEVTRGRGNWDGREGANAALTVGLRADEAGGGAVKEGEKASHGEADVGVSRPQVQSGEARDLDLQNVLRSHLDVGYLRGGHTDSKVGV